MRLGKKEQICYELKMFSISVLNQIASFPLKYYSSISGYLMNSLKPLQYKRLLIVIESEKNIIEWSA